MQPILAWLRYRPLSSSLRKLSTTSSCLASPTKALLGLGTLETPEQHKLAKEWVDNFRRDDIPKDAWEATYSRSSGPGGQVSLTLSSIYSRVIDDMCGAE